MKLFGHLKRIRCRHFELRPGLPKTLESSPSTVQWHEFKYANEYIRKYTPLIGKTEGAQTLILCFDCYSLSINFVWLFTRKFPTCEMLSWLSRRLALQPMYNRVSI